MDIHTIRRFAFGLALAGCLGALSASATTTDPQQEPDRDTELLVRNATSPGCRIEGFTRCRVGCYPTIMLPVLTHRVEPDLSAVPPAHPTGVAVLDLAVDEAGQVRQVCVLRGLSREVDEAVVRAVLKWEYAPAIVKKAGYPGKAVGDALGLVMTVTVKVK